MDLNQIPKKRQNPFASETKVVSKVSTLNEKEKYTAVMDKELRISVKVASAKRGLQFSQYIEEAVREKLSREGN